MPLVSDTLHITLSPETSYATRDNIVFPGVEAGAEAAEVLANARVTASLPSAGTPLVVKDIPIANP